jgi:hypothetical protein
MVVLLQVQLVPCEELETKHYASGRKLMDAAYLEQYLEQQEVWGSIAIDQVGENKQIMRKILLLSKHTV